MEIEVNNKTEYEMSRKEIENVSQETLNYLIKEEVISGDGIFLSIALIDKEEIKKINNQYRKKNEPTDVLSFCYKRKKGEISGEIILCPDVIMENAEKDGIKFRQEFKKNIIHGILHIIGFEHNEKMFVIQEGILNSLK